MKVLRLSSSLRTVFIFYALVPGVLLPPVLAKPEVSVGKKPSVVLQASKTPLTYPCPAAGHSLSGSCPSITDLLVRLTSTAKDFSKPNYFYTVTGGRIIGEGHKVTWDLNDVGPGSYTATVEVQDNKKHRALSSVVVEIRSCADCVISDWCPTAHVDCYDQVKTGTPITCKAVVSPWLFRFTLEWSVHDSNGENLLDRISRSGQYVSIRTEGLGGRTVTATVEVKGLEPHCPRTASFSTTVKP